MTNLKWACALVGTECWECEELFDTKEEAIKIGREMVLEANKKIVNGYVDVFNNYREGEIESFEVGQLEVFEPYINAEGILDIISEEAYESCEAEDYLWDVLYEDRDILEKRLNDVLKDWLKEIHHEPRFYSIKNIQEVPVKEEK